jgi:stage II sporulation protein D
MVSPLESRLRFIIISLILPITYQLSAIACFAQPAKYIRVAVVQNTDSLNLKALGDYEIIDSPKQKILSRGSNLKTTVTTYKNKILLGNLTTDTAKIFIKVNERGVILINGRKFSGNVELIKKSNDKLLALNYIDLENYIKGILYHEASHYWPMEALKAQAIASRTYAVYQIQQNRSKDYDVTSDIYSQVYGGLTSERFRTNEAVSQTEGQILVYQGKAFPAYFHATCGGHTEDASALWNIDIPLLKGVACNFCKDSPHSSWHYVLTLDEIEEKLADAGKRCGNIKDIVALGKDKSGRVTDLNVSCAKKDLKISAKDFRQLIGPNIIRSANFKVNVVDRDAVFEGLGWGHGVGLCQWGAYFMAKDGHGAEEILKYYYPGVNVETY